MFGGIAFLLHGNLLVGVWQNSLIVRLGPEQAAPALGGRNVGPVRRDRPANEGLGDG